MFSRIEVEERAGALAMLAVAFACWSCSGSTPARPGTGGTAGGVGGSAGSYGGASGLAGGAGSLGEGGGAGGGPSSGAAGSGVGGRGGAPGAGGQGATAAGGAGALGGTKATGGASAVGGAGAAGSGNGGSAGSPGACGDAGDPCCAGNVCNANLACLNGTTCSCVKALTGRYVIRTDGALLYESDPSSTAQTPVLDGTTGLPLVGMTDVQEGANYGCAVQGASKTAWCWRTAANGNQYGQLGNGTTDTLATSFQATPVLLAANTTLTNVVGISRTEGASLGGGTSCAVTADGKLYCWGVLAYLVNGGKALDSSYAVPITTDGVNPFTGVLKVAVYSSAGSYACAIVSGTPSNQVACWGYNGRAVGLDGGGLGLGDTMLRMYPTNVLGIADPQEILTQDGNFGSTCVRDGQNVRCWGTNTYGEIATGTAGTKPILSPSLVKLGDGSTLGNVISLHGSDSSQYATFCAMTGTGAVICWGYDYGPSPVSLNVANVAMLGGTGGGLVRYLTNDGTYHLASASNHVGTTRAPNCGALH